ncbi:phenylacetic acid degradation protein PaaD [Saccharothrix yanglingensis]|uniref:Phenylacetic acid degradation protein PaaD n=2 Tax=Pseudonocardiaceae TaxID=2070 RepID=A0ABU0X1Z7_9PSEU|nr:MULTISPECIES: hydroxyphenylacetyl-CoA thioesterase PaaI [Saccharothrix]MDQ2586156.1 phenylacetic acid degradation protein PaaD [Saccharothrix yanglingensis]MDU0290062.1 hydroxyphenylacetyl-CoA thioesterase PaaI [Saccharothrix longispora]
MDPAEMLANDPASQALGIRALELGDGTARVAMVVTERMINGHGIGHGGYVFLLADTAFACACNRHGAVTVAAQAEIDFLAPVRAGDELVAEAVERVRFGRSGIYDITVRRGDEVVAEFRGRSRTLRPSAADPAPGGR